jgi:hypothetical protein
MACASKHAVSSLVEPSRKGRSMRAKYLGEVATVPAELIGLRRRHRES